MSNITCFDEKKNVIVYFKTFFNFQKMYLFISVTDENEMAAIKPVKFTARLFLTKIYFSLHSLLLPFIKQSNP